MLAMIDSIFELIKTVGQVPIPPRALVLNRRTESLIANQLEQAGMLPGKCEMPMPPRIAGIELVTVDYIPDGEYIIAQEDRQLKRILDASKFYRPDMGISFLDYLNMMSTVNTIVSDLPKPFSSDI
jgi:hypothetical protein